MIIIVNAVNEENSEFIVALICVIIIHCVLNKIAFLIFLKEHMIPLNYAIH